MRTRSLPLWAAGLLLPLLFLMSCKKDNSPEPAESRKTYLLVHGAAHGAWSWNKVVPLLESKGHRALAIDLPGHGNDQTPPESVSLDDYVDKLVQVANAQAGRVILVGHSSGGVTIAQAAERLGINKVEKLIFLDAFSPGTGESVFSLAAQFLPPTPGEPDFTGSFVFDPNGASFTLDTSQVTQFLYHDCSPADIAFAKANLGKQPVAPLATTVHLTEARYGPIPKFFIVCTEARNGNMTQMAHHMPMQKIVNLASSHSPFFSKPEQLTELMVNF